MEHLPHQRVHVFQRNAAQKFEGHVKIAIVYDRDHRIANAPPINAGRLFLIRIGHPLPSSLLVVFVVRSSARDKSSARQRTAKLRALKRALSAATLLSAIFSGLQDRRHGWRPRKETFLLYPNSQCPSCGSGLMSRAATTTDNL